MVGTAALVRARFPGLNQEQVRRAHHRHRRRHGRRGHRRGHGEPGARGHGRAAVRGRQRARGGRSAADRAARPDAIAKVPPRDETAIGIATAVGGGALLAAMVAVALALLVPLGRRRGWRPGRTS
ncbi:hypothetical protein ACFSTC_50045 [Nonomuraea ferruginea]